jgi:chemotaxis protein methyltransferase CheR
MTSILSAEDVDCFRQAVAAHMGMRFDNDRLSMLEEALATRLHVTSTRVDDYVARHLPKLVEQGEVARLLSVVETYFLRNREQFHAFSELLRSRAASGARYLRVLSAGCSSGEEPYSIALTIREVLPDFASWDVSITAFDLNPDGLARAKAGCYRTWSLRETPADLQQRYFTQRGDEFTLDPAIRGMARFEPRNLADPDPLFWRPEVFDVIFCRNVLMYLTPEATRGVVERFARSLAPGGHLFLGHAETLRGVSGAFNLCHTHGTFYYRKRAHAEEIEPPLPRVEVPMSAMPLPADISWFEAIADSSRRIRSLSAGDQVAIPAPAAPPEDEVARAMGLWRLDRFQEALAVLSGASGNGDDPDRLLLRAMLLVSSADSEAATRACDRLLEIDELNAGAHYVKALCSEHAGNPREAIEHDQAAVYLDANFAMPHLHLGLLARRVGDRETARRELLAARNLFAREDAGRIVLFGGGFGREQLISLCEAELKAAGGAHER